MDKKLDKINIMELIKKDKVRNIIIIVGLCGIVLIYLSTLFSSDSKAEETTAEDTLYFSATEYEEKLEARLSKIITAITGEENPEIMVTLESSNQYVYAKDEKNSSSNSTEYEEGSVKESQNSADDENSYIILKDSNGSQYALKITEIQPEIKGVVVVSKYADDIIVQEKIINAMKTALNISSSKVCVVSAK